MPSNLRGCGELSSPIIVVNIFFFKVSVELPKYLLVSRKIKPYLHLHILPFFYYFHSKNVTLYVTKKIKWDNYLTIKVICSPDETTKNKNCILDHNQKASPENMERPFDCLKMSKLLINGNAILQKTMN